jgi:formylglycine-generating enzyme required for sulfatase activity
MAKEFAFSGRFTAMFRLQFDTQFGIISQSPLLELCMRFISHWHEIGLIFLLVTACATAQEKNAPEKKYCLLVGVENYEHKSLSDLKYSVDDVLALGNLLKAQGFDGRLLTDDTGAKNPALLPTKANIEKHLQELARGCKAHDTLLLTFTGHGLQFTGSPDAYFCPQDARPFSDETQTLVSVTKIYSELEKSFAGVKIILVDACRNDPDPGRGRGLDADSVPVPPKGVAALFSCSAGQRAYEHDTLQHGVFFSCVLQGLQGAAANKRGEITFNGLSEYIGETVPERMQQLFPGRKEIVQSPNQKADLIGRSPVLARVNISVTPPDIIKNDDGQLSTNPKAGTEWDKNSIGMKFVYIPPGKFTMGSPASEKDRSEDENQVEVEISREFYLGKYEVTRREWKAVMNTEPWRGKEVVKDGNDFPITYVSWYDASEFCSKMSSQDKSGFTYRLPTEAEWEYACRAGMPTPYCFGNNDTRLRSYGDVQINDYAWWSGNYEEGNTKDQYVHEVGLKKPNKFGLCDMHGNVEEWCSDYYRDKLPGGQNPSGATTGMPIYRGGSWRDLSRDCRSACRSRAVPGYSFDNLGFRVALVPTSKN